MFASLKNKIREETGSDVVIKVNPPFGKRAPSSRGRHSRTGSTTSLNSIMSTDGVRDDQNVSPISSKFDEEELQKILAKKDAEFEKILKDKELEWNKQLEERENDKISALKEKEDLDKRILELEELLKITEEQKRKLAAYREDKEQLESLQAQEIGKVKQLLLQREKELAEKTSSLKENSDLVESLRGQISRLRHSEQELSCVQDELETLRHASAREKAALASQLAQSEEETRHLRDRVELLEKRVNNVEADNTEPDDKMKALLSERNLLEQRLEEAHFHLADIKSSWSEKITSLETQVGRLSRQAAEEGTERRRALNERDILKEKVKQLEFEVEKSKHEIETRETKINRLVTEVDELSAELRDLRTESDEEVTFLRKQIENTDDEVRELRERLANVELRAETVQADYARALATAELEKTTNKQLHSEIEQLRIDLKTEQDKCKEICSSYDKERNDKDATLLRNAQVSQEVEIARQRIANQDTELAELSNRLADLERVVLDKDSQLSKTESEITSLKSNVNKLEEDVLERDKNIKVLQQRLAIMKKTLQRELRSNDSDTQVDNLNDNTINLQSINNSNTSSNTPAAVLQPTSQTTKYVGTNDSGTSASSASKQNTNTDEDDINFKYLKHVIIKFLTSREYEAKHLTRAVATLLKFSPEEERLLHETLEWKMSWFGSRPKVGNGQLAKAIPPS